MTADVPVGPVKRRAQRAVRGALAGAGFALIVWIFRAVGWPAIEANLAAIGGWFPLLVAIYLGPQAAFCLGWWLLMEPRPPIARLPRLFGVYLAGDAVNYLAPGGVAGEPFKVRLLAPDLEPGRALASVTLHKHAELTAQWAFVVAGVVVAISSFALPPGARLAALLGAGVLTALLLLLTWALRRGTYAPALAWLARFRPLASRLSAQHEGAQAVDDRIRSFYGARPLRFAAAIGLSFLGWCGGWLETYIVLRLLSPGRGWAAALVVEALSMIVTTALLFVPARVGSAEGARLGACLLVGLTAAQGVAYGLVRRARELLWALPGLLILLGRGWGRVARRPAARLASLADGEAGP